MPKVIGIISLILSIGLLLFLINADKKRHRENTSTPHSKKAQWSEEQIPKMMEELDSDTQTIVELFKNHKREEAQKLILDNALRMAPFLQHWGNDPIDGKASLREYCNKRLQTIRQARIQELEHLKEKSKNGEITIDELMEFATADAGELELNLKKELERSMRELDEARAPLAADWLRVLIIGDKAYQAAIRESLTQKWSDAYRFKIIFSNPAGFRERSNTWKELVIDIDETNIDFKLPGRTGFGNRSLPRLPEKIDLRFSWKTSKSKTPTSWDNLKPFTCKTRVPDSLPMVETANIYEKMEQKAQQLRNNLSEKIKENLSTIPIFKLFPGLSKDEITLFEDGEINAESAHAMALIDPDRFRKEAALIFNQKEKEEEQAVLMQVIIEEKLDSMADWTAEVLKTAPKETQREVIKHLRLHSSLGNYKPALALLNSDDFHARSQIIFCLKDDLDEPIVRNAFEKIIKNKNDELRGTAAKLFLKGIPEDELPKYFHLALSEDQQFAKEAYITCYSIKPAETLAFALKNFKTAPHQFQWAVLNNFDFNFVENAESWTNLFVHYIESEEAGFDLRQSCLNHMIGHAHKPPVFKRLLKLDDDLVLPRWKENITFTLIGNVRRAMPEEAKEFLWQKLPEQIEKAFSDYKDNIENDRGSIPFSLGNSSLVINQLFECYPDKKQEVLEKLHKILIERNEEPNFLFQVLYNINHLYRIRKGWDWEQKELMDFLEKGATHPHEQTRKQVAAIAAYAYTESKGNEFYRELFQKLTGEELPEYF